MRVLVRHSFARLTRILLPLRMYIYRGCYVLEVSARPDKRLFRESIERALISVK